MKTSLDEAFLCPSVPAEIMDRLWESGWRHFGPYFFRYSHFEDGAGEKNITPLRLDLQKHSLTKSQRRVLRRNADLRHEFVPAEITDQARQMFQRHRDRFRDNVPENLETFLSSQPASVPCECLECRVYLGEELIALSYLDIGHEATSSVYAMFEPAHSWRSLGIYTLLLEIAYSRERGCTHYYPGYATQEPSAYDYKKQLRGLEMLDWQTGTWVELQASEAGHAPMHEPG